MAVIPSRRLMCAYSYGQHIGHIQFQTVHSNQVHEGAPQLEIDFRNRGPDYLVHSTLP